MPFGSDAAKRAVGFGFSIDCAAVSDFRRNGQRVPFEKGGSPVIGWLEFAMIFKFKFLRRAGWALMDVAKVYHLRGN
jgi:hypothetical protein